MSEKSTCYILDREYALCGFRGLPFGLRVPGEKCVKFFNREQYEMILMLDGQTELIPEALTESQRNLFDQLVEQKIAVPLEQPGTLLPEQMYHSYPAMYKAHVQWSITGTCNYRCRHCFMSAPDNRFAEPTWEQCEDAIHQMAECGIRNISLTGGEPLISPHLYRIFDECKACGLSIDTIYSNGKLVTKELLEELKRRDMQPGFHMSYDGIGWHDWLRGVPGAEAAVLDAFRLCREHGFSTSSSFVLHAHNLEGFHASIRLLDSLGVKHVKSNIASPTGLWAKETEHFLDPDATYRYLLEKTIPQYMEDGLKIGVQFCLLLDYLPEKGEGYIPAEKFSGKDDAEKQWACGSVKKEMYLSPEGFVLPCMQMVGTAIQSRFDSLYDRPLREILSDSTLTCVSLMKMGEVIEANEECRNCEYRLHCGAGCRAAGLGETCTDYHAVDREVCHFFKAGWYEKSRELLQKLKKDRKPIS